MDISRLVKKAGRELASAKKSARRPVSRRNINKSRQSESENGNDTFTTQLSVCIILIVFAFAVSKIKLTQTENFTVKLKTAIANQTSVEVMAQTAKTSINKADNFFDNIKNFFGIEYSDNGTNEAPQTTENTESGIGQSSDIIIEQTSEMISENTNVQKIPESAIEPAVMEEIGVGKEEAEPIAPPGP